MSTEKKPNKAADANPADSGHDELSKDFIRQRIVDELAEGRHTQGIHARFPPEPNGYLHIGHAKSICLNFGIAQEFGGKCNLRFDDTNPLAEDTEYVDSIKEDVRWLGFQWDGPEYFASDYFESLYEMAVRLIEAGKAYVCSLSTEQVREYRGNWHIPGRESPDRQRSVADNLDLFRRMRAGEFPDGTYTLRAKIDMAAPNMNLRDPAMYRIRHAHHHRTGDQWCIYPTYDFAHGQSDSLEGITHSICTLEFEDHRPLYDWFVKELEIHPPQQIEFARLNLTNTVMSKRRLLELVKSKLVAGWDDPRMPTICGLRRRGYTPAAIRQFCADIGVTKFNSTTPMARLEEALRHDLNEHALRVMAVLEPLKVVIENFPEGEVEYRNAANHPGKQELGVRQIPLTREIYIEQSDFMEDAPTSFFRLKPGGEVRLRYGYVIQCHEVIKDETTGQITELRCTYDPDTAGGKSPAGRKVKGTIHWVSADHCVRAEVRLYDRLLLVESLAEVAEGEDWKAQLNPDSLTVLNDCCLEPSLAEATAGQSFQFERNGYFCLDAVDSKPGALVFNRSVSLREAADK
jgi:glutaminyl-tRNA synthetase